MNVLNRLTWQNLIRNRRRTIVTIIGIVLSAAMICGVATIAASFQDLFLRSAMITDGNYHAAFYGVKVENSRYITENPYTREVMMQYEMGHARMENPKNEAKPYLSIQAYDEAALNHLPVRLKEGRLPQQAGEILVAEEALRGMEDLVLGGTISLAFGSRMLEGEALTQQPLFEDEEFLITEEKVYTIIGVMERPRFWDWNTPSYAAITFMEPSMLEPEDIVKISILSTNPRQIFDRAPEMAKSADSPSVGYNYEMLRWMGISQSQRFNNALNMIALIIISLIVLGSVIVIYNAFAISVSERKKQFGMLASIGASPRQIRRTVFFEGVLLGLAGIPLGILAGVVGIGITLQALNRLLMGLMFRNDISLRVVVSPSVIATTVFFVGLIIFLSAYIPARKASRVSPIEAIRMQQDISIKAKRIKTMKLTRRLFGMEGELALKNLKRNRRRYRATVFSLFISIVLFVSISAFMQYGFAGSDMYYSDIPYDVIVEKYEAPIEVQMAFYTDLAALQEVERHAMIRSFSGEAPEMPADSIGSYLQRNYLEYLAISDQGNYRMVFNITTIGEVEFAHYVEENGLRLSDFQDTHNPKGILINRNVIEDAALIEYVPLNMKQGETVKLQDYQYVGEGNPQQFNIEIGAVTERLPFGVTYVNFQAANLIVSEEVYEVLKLQMDDRSAVLGDRGRIFLKTADGINLEQTIQQIDSRYPESRNLYYQDITAMREDTERTRMVFAILLYGFLSLITLIGVTNIFNTISTNVALRRREFAMLKSIGLTPQGFNRILCYESFFYGFKSLLYGLPASILISVLLYNAFSNMVAFRFRLPVYEILYCTLGVFIIVFVTMMYAGARLKKENIMDALREENL